MRYEMKNGVGQSPPFSLYYGSSGCAQATYHENKTSERYKIMTNQHDVFKLSSLIPYLSYLKFKKRFTLIELLVVDRDLSGGSAVQRVQHF